jgi:hypothetical protein
MISQGHSPNWTSLPRHRPSRFFECPGYRKWVRMAFRHLETKLHLLQQSRILRRPESRLWLFSIIRLLESSLARIRPSLFWMPRMQKMSSHGLSTPSIIASLTSIKSHFRTSRKQIMISQGILLLETSISRIRPSRLFGWPGCRKWLCAAFRYLNTSLHRLHQSTFYDVQKSDYELSGPVSYFKCHLCEFFQVAFSDAQDAEN